MTDHRRQEAQALGRIGVVLRAADLPPVQVTLPRELAQLAVAAWECDDEDDIPGPEHPAAALARHRAGTLALIGLEIIEQGLGESGDVIVKLPPELIGVAMDSADDLVGEAKLD